MIEIIKRVFIQPNFGKHLIVSTSRVESERPGPRLQNSLLAAVDSDRRQQWPEEHQDCPPTRTLCPCVWRVSAQSQSQTTLSNSTEILLFFFCQKMQIAENFERSGRIAAAWIWDHLVIYLALSAKGLTSFCTQRFYTFIFVHPDQPESKTILTNKIL